MDMFFKKNGLPFENYWEQLNKKYLLGSFRNPALIRINFILKRQKLGFSGASYLTCSNNCDFILPVGGNLLGGAPGTDGCQNPY